MDEETLLIIGAIGVGLYFLKDTLKPIGQGIGELSSSTAGILNLPKQTAEIIVEKQKGKNLEIQKDIIIAEGERTINKADIRQTGVNVSAQTVSRSPTVSNLASLKASLEIQKASIPKSLGGSGLLPPSIINLGSTPVKTQTLSIYAKLDSKLGGILPGGIPRTLFKKQ